MSGRSYKEIMNRLGIERALSRISHEILERNRDADGLVVIGIKGGGVFLARRLVSLIEKMEGVNVPLGEMDITLYRDDSKTSDSGPIIHKTEIPCSITDRKVVLVDDVIFTGRTIRAALDSLMNMGRPRLVQLAVLIDRGNREVPIQPDYVGKTIPVLFNEQVHVSFQEDEGEDRVTIEQS